MRFRFSLCRMCKEQVSAVREREFSRHNNSLSKSVMKGLLQLRQVGVTRVTGVYNWVGLANEMNT